VREMATTGRWRWLAFLLGVSPSTYMTWESIGCGGELGVVTAPLCTMEGIGWFLLTAAVVTSWWQLRLAAVISVAGVLLCLPLYAYRVAPGMYDWTGIPRCCSTEFWGFYTDGVEGVLAAALTLCVSGLVLALPSRRSYTVWPSAY
jgi:hypothetical protein